MTERPTDERRLMHIAHAMAGHQANLKGWLRIVQRDRERGVDPAVTLAKLEEAVLAPNVLWAREYELYARGADDAAQAVYDERQSNFRRRNPL